MNLLFVILSIPGFLRTIGILVIVYYGIKFVVRLLFPVVVKKAMNNMQARQNFYTREQKHEGEVTVESKRRDQNRSKNTEGEYVDFEEVD